ncbi:class I SAM-dependent methyltransferase [Actinophytocola sp.]|uniref:class I SAM-dependent methyltransferase n=1 Tax=Actinophytocola sp. TaxID=1872138 RepID=UPI00389A6539
MSISPPTARSEAARIFNSAVAAFAIAAAWELGAMDELHRSGALDARRFAIDNGLDEQSTLGLCRALAAVGVVDRDGARVSAGPNFAEIHRNRSFFHWLARGSAELFRDLPTVIRTANRTGDFYQRDGAAIAYACREINTLCYEPSFQKAMAGLGCEFRVVADLGSGSGERVMDVLRRYPGTRGIGVDIAASAVDMAQREADRTGLADRVTFLRADVLRLAPRPEFNEVELITCFMMGHDFWPKERCVDTLRLLRRMFPKARRFLLGDATRTSGIPDTELPVFTLGFELAHDLMGVYLPTVQDWESVFEAGGWSVRATYPIDLTVGEVIFELQPSR